MLVYYLNEGFKACWFTTLLKDSLVYYINEGFNAYWFTTVKAGLLPNEGFKACWFTTLLYYLNEGFKAAGLLSSSKACWFTTLMKDSRHAGLLP